MPTKQLFDSWIKLVGDVMFLGATQPDATKFFAILSNSSAITRNMTMAQVIALELPTTNGYSRQQLLFSSGTYNTTRKRYELPNLNINFSANNSGQFQFQTLIIIADAVFTVGSTTGKLVGFSTEDAPVIVAANQTQPFVIPVATLNTGYVNGV
jgi:hypothetical protein